eukprot:4811896-Amphidinium_carterae.1
MCLKARLRADIEYLCKRQDNPFSHQQHALVWPLAAYKHFGVKRVWSLGDQQRKLSTHKTHIQRKKQQSTKCVALRG